MMLTMLGFMVFIGVFMMQAADTTVTRTTQNAYAESLDFDATLRAQQRATDLDGELKTTATPTGLRLCLPAPEPDAPGTARLMQLPSEGTWQEFAFRTDSAGCAEVPADVQGRGWLLQLQWKQNGQDYRIETTLHF
jgi:hypothetical protein